MQAHQRDVCIPFSPINWICLIIIKLLGQSVGTKLVILHYFSYCGGEGTETKKTLPGMVWYGTLEEREGGRTIKRG